MLARISMAAVWVAAAAFVLAPLPSAAKDVSDVKVSLQEPAPGNGNGNGNGNGHGKKKGGPGAEVRMRLETGHSILQIRTKALLPDTEYHVLLDGAEVATFFTESNGQANVQLRNPSGDAALLLDFDPRGKTLTLNDGVQDIYSAVISGEGEPAGIKVSEDVTIPPTDLGQGDVNARYKVLPNAKRHFDVKTRGLVPGIYDLMLDGFLIATFETNDAGNAQLQFRAGPGSNGSGNGKKHTPMDFDPRYKLLEVVQGASVFFSGPMLADVNVSGLDACGFLPLELELTLDPAQLVGSGHASLGSDVDCGLAFHVSAAALAAGDYDVVVGGTVEGTLSVVDDGGSTAGEVVFVAAPDEPGEALLDFDPRGQVVEIRQGATVFLTGLFPL